MPRNDNYLRKKYKLTNDDIARMLGYSSTNSFDSSSAKPRILKGVDKIIQHIEDKLVRLIKG